MTDRELMQMALDALSMAVEPKKGKVYAFEFQPIDCAAMHFKAIEALRARLAQPEPEPVAWYYAGSDVEWHSIALDADLDDAQKANCTPLYTAPPQREWQGLTDEEVRDFWSWSMTQDAEHIANTQQHAFARAIEAKLKEKNHD